jgi:hypothetical protein
MLGLLTEGIMTFADEVATGDVVYASRLGSL